jgi:Fe-S-cluster containining protein
MDASSATDSDLRTATVRLAGEGWEMRFRLTVPAGPTTRRRMLPVLQEMTNAVVDAAVQMAEGEGRTVSCRKGCGACCRQLVPLSPTDARRVAELVEEMPGPRRAAVRARFAEARRRLQEAGLLEKLRHTGDWAEGEVRETGLAYFRLGIPCPFLEEESCSIHPDRPLPCREYLVTSPAEECTRPTAETVRCVPLPIKVSRAALRLDDPEPGARHVPWVPLALAPDWAADHPEGPAERTGPEWAHLILAEMTGKPVPSAASGA